MASACNEVSSAGESAVAMQPDYGQSRCLQPRILDQYPRAVLIGDCYQKAWASSIPRCRGCRVWLMPLRRYASARVISPCLPLIGPVPSAFISMEVCTPRSPLGEGACTLLWRNTMLSDPRADLKRIRMRPSRPCRRRLRSWRPFRTTRPLSSRRPSRCVKPARRTL
jgi:hypothetical protein